MWKNHPQRWPRNIIITDNILIWNLMYFTRISLSPQNPLMDSADGLLSFRFSYFLSFCFYFSVLYQFVSKLTPSNALRMKNPSIDKRFLHFCRRFSFSFFFCQISKWMCVVDLIVTYYIFKANIREKSFYKLFDNLILKLIYMRPEVNTFFFELICQKKKMTKELKQIDRTHTRCNIILNIQDYKKENCLKYEKRNHQLIMKFVSRFFFYFNSSVSWNGLTKKRRTKNLHIMPQIYSAAFISMLKMFLFFSLL